MPAIPRYEPFANIVGKGHPVTPQTPYVKGGHVDEVPTNGFISTNGAPMKGVRDREKADSRANAFVYRDETALTPRRKIKVFTIGAGIAGLILAHKIQHQYPEMQDIIEHTIFEALHTVGGTWYLNTYPGVQCDVPAHVYVSPSSRSTICEHQIWCNGPGVKTNGSLSHFPSTPNQTGLISMQPEHRYTSIFYKQRRNGILIGTSNTNIESTKRFGSRNSGNGRLPMRMLKEKSTSTTQMW